MHQNTCDLTPLPDVDVNPLQDFVYPEAFSPQPESSPESTHLSEVDAVHRIAEMLPAFNMFFERDCNLEEAIRSSPKSGNLAVNERSRSYTRQEELRRGPFRSCVTAPVWNPREEHRASGAAGGSGGASWEERVPVCDASLARTANRKVPVEEVNPRKRKRNTFSLGFSSSSPVADRPFSLPRHPSGCSSTSLQQTERSDEKRRRMRCNLRERQRAKGLNDAFSVLKEVLPLPKESKSTKLQTLRAASQYIEFLHEVYGAWAHEIIFGQVPKETKCGVRYTLSGFRRKPMRAVVEVLSCGFNLWIGENKFDDEKTERRAISGGDTNSSPLSPLTVSSPTTSSYPSTTTSSLLSSTLSPVGSSTLSPCSPSQSAASPPADESHPQQKPAGQWTWDY